MDLTLVTAPVEDPVTLAEAKAHLRVTSADEDALIGALIDAATAYIDGRDGVLGRALVTQTWDYKIDYFPLGAIKLPLPPLQSVTSIKYLGGDGVEQTLAAGEYRVLSSAWFPLVDLEYGKSWPTTRRVRRAVTVRIVVGYGAASAVPQSIKAALLLLIGHLYEHREENQDFAIHAMPLGVPALLAPHRMLGF